ncbi:phosphate sodium symporter [gut metagenome]|uniref:Phosphate sodium symporter n=1 Tax=gut metagenome TaxID=749906 RepID=J9H056_9ZZZZ
MEWMYLGMVVFLFVLAAFDLWVGVSNDAVNFLNSAIGSRAARFRTVVTIAAVGVFCGAVMSDGMMDIARHGIFNPELFYFKEVMYIFLAVMVTDIVLLDIFNSLGMPTSTTVSMVFELLGASFALAMIKVATAVTPASFGDYLNTDKALQVIIAIFLSVAIAFVVGALVQYLTRIVFTFHYKSHLRWKMGIFGGIAITSIIYFMLFKGMKHLSFMTPEVLAYINDHVGLVLGGCLIFFTILMQLLHAFGLNVFRIVVLTGTFALAMAFAGNDLVNFIGVPLAGLASFQYFTDSGATDVMGFTMDQLNGPATTPLIYLFAAGAIMVVSLATSKKAHNVVKTSISLSSKDEGDEMFGSSRVARSLVRWGNSVGSAVQRFTPDSVLQFIDTRFLPNEEEEREGATFDLVRAAINLVVAALLIALGTSLKLPLSTTYVTFMVAMGTSLADRAWTRESAVFRITGVLTVIGGWFITAGVAFTACFFVALAMYYGGEIVVFIIIAAGIYALYHSQQRYKRKQSEVKEGDELFKQILACQDRKQIIPMVEHHVNSSTANMLEEYATCLRETTDGLMFENRKPLRQAAKRLNLSKREQKNLRRREIICLRRAEPADAVRLSTSFHMVHNSLRQILYGLLRINEPAREHVDNHFTPIGAESAQRFMALRNRLDAIIQDAADNLRHFDADKNRKLREDLKDVCENFRNFRYDVMVGLQACDANVTTETLLLHVIQETEQIVVELRVLLKNCRRFHELA